MQCQKSLPLDSYPDSDSFSLHFTLLVYDQVHTKQLVHQPFHTSHKQIIMIHFTLHSVSVRFASQFAQIVHDLFHTSPCQCTIQFTQIVSHPVHNSHYYYTTKFTLHTISVRSITHEQVHASHNQCVMKFTQRAISVRSISHFIQLVYDPLHTSHNQCTIKFNISHLLTNMPSVLNFVRFLHLSVTFNVPRPFRFYVFALSIVNILHA